MRSWFAGTEQSQAFIQGQKVRAIYQNGQNIYHVPVVAYSLTNILSNGGFETNVTGWTSSFSGQPTRIAIPAPAHGELGSWCAQNTGTVNGAHWSQHAATAITNGNRYYVRARIRYSTLGMGNIVQFMNTTTALAGIPSLTMTAINQWFMLDGIWSANATSLSLRFNFTNGNGNNIRTAQIDNVMVINLTQAFGGNEPPIEILREAISNEGGFWDGTRTVNI